MRWMDHTDTEDSYFILTEEDHRERQEHCTLTRFLDELCRLLASTLTGLAELSINPNMTQLLNHYSL